MIFKRKSIDQQAIEAVLKVRQLLMEESKNFRDITEDDPFWKESLWYLPYEDEIAKIDCPKWMIEKFENESEDNDFLMDAALRHLMSNILAINHFVTAPHTEHIVNVTNGVRYEASLFKEVDHDDLGKMLAWGRTVAGLALIARDKCEQETGVCRVSFLVHHGYKAETLDCPIGVNGNCIMSELMQIIKNRELQILKFKNAATGNLSDEVKGYFQGLPLQFRAECIQENNRYKDTYVIQPDGNLRAADFFITEDGRVIDGTLNLDQNRKATKLWAQILPGEMVINAEIIAEAAENQETKISYHLGIDVLPATITERMENALDEISKMLIRTTFGDDEQTAIRFQYLSPVAQILYAWSCPYSHSFTTLLDQFEPILGSLKYQMPKYYYDNGILMNGDPGQDLPEEIWANNQLVGKPAQLHFYGFSAQLGEDQETEANNTDAESEKAK